jgi:hypothetical protein
MKQIRSKKISTAKARARMLNALNAEGKDVVAEYEKTTATWKGDAPEFAYDVSYKGGDLAVAVGPTGDEKGVQKWNWLDEGTKIRWALMSPDWESKTQVRVYGSGSGSGRVLIAGRRAMEARGIAPRPGIEAREWTLAIVKRRKDKFRKRVLDALHNGLGG